MRRMRIGIIAGGIAAAVVTGILLAPGGPAGAAPTPQGGTRLVVNAADPLAPSLVLTNLGTAACQIATTSLGTVGVVSLTQSGAEVSPISTDPSFPDGLDVYLAGELTTLAPGASATIKLSVVPIGPTGHAIETVTWSQAASLGALYPVKDGSPLALTATYAVPVVPASGPPLCAVAASGGVGGVAAPAAGPSSHNTVLLIIALLVLLLIIVAAVVVARSAFKRHRSTVPPAVALVLFAALALVAVWPARPAFATITVDPSLSGAYAACGPIFGMAGGDPAGILPTLNDPKNHIQIVPANGDQTHEIQAGGTIIIFWDPNDHHTYSGGGGNASPCDSLYHEMYHGNEDLHGGQDHSDCVTAAGDSGLPVNEVNATRAQNLLRAKEGLPQRTTYGDTPLPSGPCLPPDQQPKPKPNCTGPGCGDTNGDPHLTTFDGARYDFQGDGEFVAARDTADPKFQIQVRQQPMPGSQVFAVNNAIAMAVGGDKVEVDMVAGAMQLLVNGAPAKTVAASLPHGGSLTVDPNTRPNIDVHWPDGSFALITVIGIWGLHLTAQPAAAHAGKLVGLLGNFDGSKTNDLRTAAGAAVAIPPTFGALYPGYADSWRITDATSLFTYPAGRNTASYTDRSFPHQQPDLSALPNRAMAQALCQRIGITDPVTLADCVLDVAASGQAAFALADLETQAVVATGPVASPSPEPTAGPTSTQSATSSESTLTVAKPNGTAKLTFPAQAGQRLFVDILSSAGTIGCGVLDLIAPTGATVDIGCISADGTGDIGGELLSSTGTYGLVFAPGPDKTGTVHFRLTFSIDQHGQLPADGSPVVATIAAPGQVGLYTFAGTAGQRAYVDASASTVPSQCGVLALRGPDGGTVSIGCTSADGTGYLDGVLLAKTGQYTVVVDPGDRGVGQVTLRLVLSQDVHGTVALGGPPVTATLTKAGQVAYYTFAGTKGEKIKVVVTASTIVSLCGMPILIGPSTVAFDEGCISADGTGGLPSLTLNETGTWAISIDPGAGVTGTVTFALQAG